jgi:hypothetical protein
MPFKVQKKDGQMEDFDRTKIVNGIIKSGGTPEEAENIAKQIEVWLPTVAVDGVVKSADIRAKLLEMLKVANPAVGAAFEAYKKPEVPPEAPVVPPAGEVPPTSEPPMAPSIPPAGGSPIA